MIAAHQANLPALRAALRLKEIVPPLNRIAALAALTLNFDLDAKVWQAIEALRAGKTSWSKSAIAPWFEQYLQELQKLVDQVDKI